MTTFEAIVPHQQNLGQTQGGYSAKVCHFFEKGTNFSSKLRKWLETLPHKKNVSRARICKVKFDFHFGLNLAITYNFVCFSLRWPTKWQQKEVQRNIF
jgi:hypothetical protein